jgi:hypothetical protein
MEEAIDLKLGFFEDVDNVHNVTNLDVYDTLSPLWKNKCEFNTQKFYAGTYESVKIKDSI